VEVVALSLVQLQYFLPPVAVDAFELPVDPPPTLPEIVGLDVNLLLPRAGCVRGEWEVGIGFLGTVAGPSLVGRWVRPLADI
jgi:hypothetical protein